MSAATLALPQLGAARGQLSVSPGDADAARAVLALYKAGRFDPGRLHPARPFPGALALMRGAFERWIRTMQGLFEDARFSLEVGVGAGSAITDWEAAHADAARSILEIIIGNKRDDPLGTVWLLKRRYEAIEWASPGLARTALAMIGLASGYGLPLWTPWAALGGAMLAYWGGCEDEREFIEANLYDYEDSDVADMGIFTRAEFDAAIPADVAQPREVLKRTALERLARSRTHKDVARIAQLCLEIRSACRRDRESAAFRDFVPDRVHEIAQLHHFASVRWSEDDPMFRIYDDWANPSYENGEALEAYGWHEVPIDADAFRTWFAGMERTFHITALGQQLLALIAEAEA